MKILLVNSPVRLSARPNCIPYGVAVIAALLEQDGHQVSLLDLNAQRREPEEILRLLSGDRWDLVGLSGLITTWRFQRWIIPEIRQRQPQALLISGGGLATSVPHLLLREPALDAAVIGEGEVTAREIVRALADRRNPYDLPGVYSRKGNRGLRKPLRPLLDDLDALPLPAWHLLPMETYLANPVWGPGASNSSGFPSGVPVRRSMNLISSRGCPFGCRFCYHLFGHGKYRFRSVPSLLREIELLVDRYQVDFVGFVDDNFAAHRERVLDFCRELRARDGKLHWGCHARVDQVDDELLAEMRAAGCVWIGYGLETGSDEMLVRMGKQTSSARAKAAIPATRRAGIFANATFIFGYPGENEESARETRRFRKHLALEGNSFFATPYPGTALYEEVRDRLGPEEEFVGRLGDATEFVVNLTSWSDQDLFRWKAYAEGKELAPDGTSSESLDQRPAETSAV